MPTIISAKRALNEGRTPGQALSIATWHEERAEQIGEALRSGSRSALRRLIRRGVDATERAMRNHTNTAASLRALAKELRRNV